MTTTADDLRRMDALVAEKVMGRKVWYDEDAHGDLHIWWEYFVDESDGGVAGVQRLLAPYTTDWAAAGQVVEKMRADGWNVSIVFKDTFPRLFWRVDFEKPREMQEGSERVDSAPLAICNAALRALGVAPSTAEGVAG